MFLYKVIFRLKSL